MHSWDTSGAALNIRPELTRSSTATHTGTGLLEASGQTDIGLRRETNQDVWCGEQLGRGYSLHAVADGHGDPLMGGIASEIAVQNIRQEMTKAIAEADELTAGEVACALEQAVQQANTRVLGMRTQLNSRMGTTLCAMVTDCKRNAWLANVGDSRIYLKRFGVLRQLTSDHSWVAAMVFDGLLAQEEARQHPLSHLLTRSLGKRPAVDVEVIRIPIHPDDRLLLCSDGLWQMLAEHNILRVLTRYESPQEACEKLIQAANYAGGLDNVTGVVVDVR